MKMSGGGGGSSRWCPTQEQLMILEEMYRGGTRTPNASQIQHITAHLSLYGKIEPKNVFYWFQNHKARDRQKLRRTLLINKQLHLRQQHYYNLHLSHNYTHHFRYLMASVTASPSRQLSLYNSLPFFSQGGPGEASRQHGIWKTENAEGLMENALMKEEWRRMMEVDPAASYWPRPLKTLELFPIRSESLKETHSRPL